MRYIEASRSVSMCGRFHNDRFALPLESQRFESKKSHGFTFALIARICYCLLLSVLFAPLPIHAQPNTYSVIDFGPIGFPEYYEVAGLNDRGDVSLTKTTITPNGSEKSGYLYRLGLIHPLASSIPAGTGGIMNNYGQIIRSTVPFDPFAYHSVVWQANPESPFTGDAIDLPWHQTYSLNKFGDLIGFYYNPSVGQSFNFLYSEGVTQNLANRLPGIDSVWSINDQKTIAGLANLNGTFQPFLLTNEGDATFIAPPDSSYAGLALNNQDTLLIRSGFDPLALAIFKNGFLISLPRPPLPLGSYITYYNPVLNDQDEILLSVVNTATNAFYNLTFSLVTGWQPITLSNSTWTKFDSIDMNNCGQITGRVQNSSGARHALFTPWGTGFVFSPDPITTTGITTLTDETPSEILDAWRTCVKLEGLDGTGYLTGEFATTEPTSEYQPRAFQPDGVFNFSRSNPHFQETMAYYHTDNFARYIHSLGFPQLRQYQVKLRVNYPDSQDIARFVQENDNREIIFGNHSVDEAEDAQIIWHENTHAIINELTNRVSETASDEFRAIEEATGDYFAASKFSGGGSPMAAEQLDGYFSVWGAQGVAPPGDIALRNLNNFKKYPVNFIAATSGDPNDAAHYKNTLIWSGMLWDLRKLSGKTRADQLALLALVNQPNFSDFEQIARSIIKANQEHFGGENANEIEQLLINRGLLKAIVGLSIKRRNNNGQLRDGTIYLSSEAPLDGLFVTLESNSPYLQVPQAVAFLPRKLSATFEIYVQPSPTVTTAKLTATYDNKNLSTNIDLN